MPIVRIDNRLRVRMRGFERSDFLIMRRVRWRRTGQEVLAVDFFLEALIHSIEKQIPQQHDCARTWAGNSWLTQAGIQLDNILEGANGAAVQARDDAE